MQGEQHDDLGQYQVAYMIQIFCINNSNEERPSYSPNTFSPRPRGDKANDSSPNNEANEGGLPLELEQIEGRDDLEHDGDTEIQSEGFTQQTVGNDSTTLRRSVRQTKPSVRLQDFVTFCTSKYPIQDYMTYNNISPKYKTFLSNVSKEVEPQTFFLEEVKTQSGKKLCRKKSKH
jgi:hypothetical protein